MKIKMSSETNSDSNLKSFSEAYHNEKGKKKQELFVGSEIDFDKPKIDKITKKKRKEKAKLVDVSFENFQLKKKEKSAKFKSCAEANIDYDKHEIKKRKKKKKNIELGDLHFEKHQRDKHTEQNWPYSDTCYEFNEAGLKQHQKEKGEELELLVEPDLNFDNSAIGIRKRKKRDKEKHNNSSTMEVFINKEEEIVHSQKQKEEKIQTNVNETDFSVKKKHKRKKYACATETNNGCYELDENHARKSEENRIKVDEAFAIDKTEIMSKKHKKKKQKSGIKHAKQILSDSVPCCEYVETELKQHKKKKSKKVEPNIDFDKHEVGQHKIKKKKKTKLEDLPIKENQSDKNMKQNIPYSETCALTTEYEIDFTRISKHKKRDKEKHDNSSAMEVFINKEEEIVHSQKQKEEKIQTNVNETDFSVKKKHKRKKYACATETNNGCYELDENHNLNLARKSEENRIKVDEAFAIDKTEIMSKKHKKKKKHPGIPEDHNTFEHDITSNYFLNETHSKQKRNYLNAAESITASDIPKIHKKYRKNQESYVYGSFISKFDTEIHELSEKSDSEIKGNKRHSVIDDFNKSSIKHKRKKNKRIIEKKDLMDANLKINTQSANYSDNVNSMFNNTFDNCADLNSLQKRKIEEVKIPKSNVKTKCKKNKENNLSIVDKQEYIYNLEQGFIEKQSTDISGISFSGDTHFNSNDNSRNFVYNKSNFEISDVDDNSVSVSDKVNKKIRKQKMKHLKSFALSESEFTADNIYDSNHHIIKEKGTVNMISDTDEVNISCFDKDLENSANLRNLTSDDRVEYTYFSPHLDCMEEAVTFEVPPLHQFETVYRLNEKQKNELKLLDIFIKEGNFTFAEDKLIQRNFEDFVKKYGISDPFSLFGLGRYKKDPKLHNFLTAKHFYVRLAKDLNDRSLHSVYKRARKILHPFKESGKLTVNEIANLKKLYVSSPNKWNLIGDTLGNTPGRCAETYRWHEKNVSKGHFTEEEKTQLIEAIKKVSNSPDISYRNVKHINWDAVATYVPTRNSSQCRMYWANNLAWTPGSEKNKWNHECFCKLVHILKKLNVENQSMIDWNKIYESFEDYAPSALYVQKRWLYLRSKVLNYKSMDYKEIVNILCNKYNVS